MVGIICPSPYEYRVLSRSVLIGRGARVILSGVGKIRAIHGCYRLLKETPDLKYILLTGFAGALSESLKIGDVFEPDVFIEEDFFVEPFEKFPHTLKRSDAGQIIGGSLAGAMLTQDRYLKNNVYKKSAYVRKYKHLACDMESYGVAYFCEKEKIPYRTVKLISDNADTRAVRDFLRACRQLSAKLNETVMEVLAHVERRFV